MIKFLTTSILIRVAAVQAMLIIGALWFIAHHYSPDATFETATGQVRHVFLGVPFITKMIGVYVIVLPFAYGITKLVIMVTKKDRAQSNRRRARSADRRP